MWLRWIVQSPFVGISMANLTIYWNYSRSEDSHPILTIFSWEITWTEVETVLKLSSFSSPSKLGTKIELPSSEATINPGLSRKCTVSMTNASANMGHWMSGVPVPMYLTIWHWLLLWMTECFVSMGAYHPIYVTWRTSRQLIESRKSHRRESCVTCFGPILIR